MHRAVPRAVPRALPEDAHETTRRGGAGARVKVQPAIGWTRGRTRGSHGQLCSISFRGTFSNTNHRYAPRDELDWTLRPMRRDEHGRDGIGEDTKRVDEKRSHGAPCSTCARSRTFRPDASRLATAAAENGATVHAGVEARPLAGGGGARGAMGPCWRNPRGRVSSRRCLSAEHGGAASSAARLTRQTFPARVSHLLETVGHRASGGGGPRAAFHRASVGAIASARLCSGGQIVHRKGDVLPRATGAREDESLPPTSEFCTSAEPSQRAALLVGPIFHCLFAVPSQKHNRDELASQNIRTWLCNDGLNRFRLDPFVERDGGTARHGFCGGKSFVAAPELGCTASSLGARLGCAKPAVGGNGTRAAWGGGPHPRVACAEGLHEYEDVQEVTIVSHSNSASP
ncbi:unnamed protein product [Lampetra planeri]